MEMDELVLARYIEAVRAEGRHTSWDYHSRASLAHRYVAMTVPKVAWGDVHAGGAGPTLLAYPTAQIVEMLRSPAYLRFSFVRNPYGRLVSAWKSKLARDDPQYDQLRASIREACDYPFANGQLPFHADHPRKTAIPTASVAAPSAMNTQPAQIYM